MTVYNKLIVLLIFSAWMNAAVAARSLVFATAPTQNPTVTKQYYQPLLNYLSVKTGRQIELQVADNFIEYSQNLLQNKYDIVFDGPHYNGWRIKKHNHQMVAKLPGTLQFVVVVKKSKQITDLKTLAGKPVCALDSPNFLTLGFLALYSNPASVPFVEPADNFKAALACLRQEKGEAAVLRTKFWLKLPARAKQGLELVYDSKIKWPHRGFSVSHRVEQETKDLLRAALLHNDANRVAGKILNRYKVDRFVAAEDSEYRDLGKLLKSIWGFHQ